MKPAIRKDCGLHRLRAEPANFDHPQGGFRPAERDFDHAEHGFRSKVKVQFVESGAAARAGFRRAGLKSRAAIEGAGLQQDNDIQACGLNDIFAVGKNDIVLRATIFTLRVNGGELWHFPMSAHLLFMAAAGITIFKPAA